MIPAANIEEFFENVKEMRAAQKRYFEYRMLDDLKRSKELEGKVDQAIEIWSDPTLF